MLKIPFPNHSFTKISKYRTENLHFPLRPSPLPHKSQFLKKGFSDPFRIDQNARGGGILLYVRVDIPTKLLSI